MVRKKPPKGFTLTPGLAGSKEAEEFFRQRLTEASSKMPGSRILIHRYRDDSVDGEIIIPVKRGVSSETLAFELEQALRLGRYGLGMDVWVSIGVKYSIEKDEEIYRRYVGMNDVGTSYQRGKRANVVEEILILRNKIVPGMRKKYRRKARMIYLRVHWNPTGERPKHKGES